MNKDDDFIKNLVESHSNNEMKWPPLWIVSFSDMMMLILTFFIFFYSVTTLQELPRVIEHLRREFGEIIPIERHEFPVPQKAQPIERTYLNKDSDVVENFRKYLKKAGLENDVKLLAGAEEIKITISNPILFDSGNATLKSGALPIMNNIAELFKGNDYDVRVEGHTDNIPINTGKFPSNWELSSARAISVIRYFIDEVKIPPTRFEATGYGEFRPTANNDDISGRAQNRRVEIKIIQKNKQ